MIHARRAALAALLALTILVAGGAVVAAHSLLASSDPAANSVLAVAPAVVSLTFTEPPDPQLSTVRVLDGTGVEHTTGPAVRGTGANTLTAPLGPLAEGVYTVAWRTVSAADGHATAGSFAFSVGTGTPAPSASAASAVPGGTAPPDSAGSSTVSAASVLARGLLYLGLLVLLGGLVMGKALLAERAPRVCRGLAVAWAGALLGAVSLFLAQTADAGVALGAALTSSLGVDAAGRLVPLLLAGGAMVLAGPSPRRRRPAAIAAIVLAALALLADAAASHASTVLAPALNVILQWLHAVGVAVWLGGLAGLLLELRGRDSAERAQLLAGFSRWATIGIVVVGLTGVARAAFQLEGLDQLTTTDYGRLLLVKMALFVALALLGSLNHFRHVPGGEAGTAGALRAGSLEVLLGATALVVATLLVTTPPPSNAAAASDGHDMPGASASPESSPAASPTPAASIAPSPIVAQGADYATTTRVRLTITPGGPGPSDFAVAVADFDTGNPIPATAIKLRFALPARPDVGASSLVLAPGADGGFGGSGSNLSLTGIWTVTVVVTTKTGTVEVPLAVAVALPSGPVDVLKVAGQPTTYTVPLPAGRKAQLYIEPSTTGGPSTLHITYFDGAGKELPVTGVKAEAAWTGVNPMSLLMSPIEPGHATAKLQPPSGVSVLVLVRGTGPDGAPIVFSLTIPPGA